MKSKQTTRILCEGGILVAVAWVLNLLRINVSALGGSINLVYIPLMVYALRRGPLWGMLAGFIFGFLKVPMSEFPAIAWQSLLLDYAVAYALVGLAGLTPKKPILGTVIGAFGCLFSFVLSGVFVWGEYMPDTFLGLTMTNAWVYAFLYNVRFTFVNWLVAAIVIGYFSKKTKLLQPEK